MSDELERLEDDAAESRGELDDRASSDEAESLESFGNRNSNNIPYNPGDSGTSIARKAAKLFINKKAGLAGGGIVGTIVFGGMLFFGGGAAELVSVKERILQRAIPNRFMNYSLESRRVNSTERVLNQMGKSSTPDDILKTAIGSTEVEERLAKAGITLARDEADNVVGATFEGATGKVALDISKKGVLNDLLKSGEVGAEARSLFNREFSTVGTTWKGKAFNRVLSKLGLNLDNFVNKFYKPSETLTPEESAARGEAQAAAEQTSPATTEGARTSGELDEDLTDEQKKNGDSNITTDDAVADSQQNAEEILNGGNADDIAARNQGTLGVGTEAAGEATEAFVNAAASGGDDVVEVIVREAPSILAKQGISGAFKNFTVGFSAVADPLLVGQTVCKAKGTINVVANARNIALAIELSRFATRYLTAADHQKAGLLSSEGLRLFMLSMHRPDKNGKTYLNSGGMQNLLNGNTASAVSPTSVGKYSVARKNTGVFGMLSSLLDRIPFGNVSCSLAKNGFINFGVTAINGVAAVLSGGATLGAEASTFGIAAVAANILGQLALELSTPFLIQLTTHQVMTHVTGVLRGDGLASGLGGVSSMTGNSNGLRIATQKQVVALSEQESVARRENIAHQSVFERYLALDNTDSFVSNVAFATATNPAFGSLNATVQSGLSLLSKPFSLFGILANVFMPGGGRAYAATTDTPDCGYPEINGEKIATDSFCNPLVVAAPTLDMDETVSILRSNDQIDAQGQPKDEFAEYVADCHSGRAGIIYKAEVSSSGTTSSDEPDERCYESGSPLTGDTIGRYDRYAAYFGYSVDTSNLIGIN